MDKHYNPDCDCPKTSHHHDYDLDYKHRSGLRCCSHKCSPHQGCHDSCSCHCHRSRCSCRKNLCDTDFSIRLSGLQDGLNFRLRQLLWCEAEFELEAGNTVKGTIVSVGSNFVEVLVGETFPLESPDHVEEEIDEAFEEDMDKESKKKNPEEEIKLVEEYEEREHEKGKSWIFSVDKIANIKLTGSCHRQCTCY